MTLSLPNDLVNDTTADASPVQQNYSYIEQYVNAEVITRDGSVGMQAPLLLVGPPTQPLHAATKAYVDSAMPIGVMLPYGGVAPPTVSWALCNGATVDTTSYAELFTVIGYRFGGSGTSFTLPNMAGRMLIGVDAADTACDTVGEYGGSSTLTAANLPSHTHPIDHDHPGFQSYGHNTDHVHWMDHAHTASAGGVTANHTHAFNVNTDWSGVHGHHIPARENPASGSAGSLGISNAGGNIVNRDTVYTEGHHNHNVAGNTGYVSSDHSHGITVNPGSHNGGWTGGSNTDHSHGVEIPPFAGTSGATGSATPYRPSFVTVAYIIRVK